VVALCLFVALALTSYSYLSHPPPSQAQATPSADLVISEIYGGGGNASATYQDDFIEIYNRGTNAQSLNGWSLQYASAASASWDKVALSGSIGPGQYYLVQLTTTAAVGANLPTPDLTTTALGSPTTGIATGDGKVALVTNNTTLTGTCPQTDGAQTTNIRDFVGYGSANCFETTAAQGPANNITSATRTPSSNDTNNNLADFTRVTPTPRPASSSFDAAAQGCDFDGLGLPRSFSWSHTVSSNTSRVLIVGVSTYVSILPLGGLPPPRVSGVTYNGVAMTRLDDLLALSPDGNSAVEMFILKEPLPAAGAHTVQVTLNAGINYAVGGSVSFNDVNQVTPTRVFTRNSGNTSPATITVASATNEIVLDTVATKFEAGILTAGAGQTERWNGVTTSCFGVLNSVGAGSTKPGATSTTTTWTEGTSQPWAMGAVSVVPLAPTEVKLSSFTASQAGAGVQLNWETGYEVDNLGFNVYREENGKRVLLNPSLVAGSALIAGAGTPLTAGFTYSWFDPQGANDSLYTLEDIALDGTRTQHGPIAPVASSDGKASSKSGQKSALLTEVSGNSPVTMQGGPAFFSKQQMSFATNKVSSEEDTPSSLLASQVGVKLSVSKNGWYRADLSELVAVGLDPAINPLMLQLYADGVEQSINVNSDSARIDGGGYIEFYGIGLDTPSTDTRTYWLVAGSKPGKRMDVVWTRQVTGNTPKPTVNIAPQIKAAQRLAEIFYLPFIRIFSETPKELTPKESRIELKPSDPGVMTDTPPPTPPSSPSPPAPAVAPAAVTPAIETTVEPVAKPKRKPSRKKKRSSKSRKAGLNKRKHHPDAGIISTPVSFAYTVERKERTAYISALQNGDAENFFGQILSSSPIEQTLNIRNLDTASDEAQLEIVLQGATTQNHQVRVQLNNVEVGTLNYTGQSNASLGLLVSPVLLREGDNTVKLTALAGSADVSLVDRLRLTYARLYRAENNSLNFTAGNSSVVNVEGFTSPKIRVLDITNPNDVQEILPVVKAQATSYTVTVLPDATNRTRNLLAFATDRFEHPAAITFNRPSTWSRNDRAADFLIITDRQFSASVKPLALLRGSQGITVSVVDVEDIFDEFSYGAHSPQAIKDFLSWASAHWQKAPRFVLFVGDGSYDPRNYKGKGQFDLIPTKMLDTRFMETAGDDWYADFDNDGIAEMAIGRLPVRTIQEADAVLSKIVNYQPSGNSSGRNVLLVSDKIGPDGFNFESTSDELKPFVPGSVNVQSIVRHDEDGATLRSQILSSLNQGPLIANYAGHGTYDKWTGDGALRTVDASALANSGKTSLFVTMTCMNGYYVDLTTDSLAEALIKADNGGAIAVWASSGITLPTRQAEINQKLFEQLFSDQGLTLGEAVQKAKAATTDADVRRTWILFGDPTMRIR
jgi:hypothetical protein